MLFSCILFLLKLCWVKQSLYIQTEFLFCNIIEHDEHFIQANLAAKRKSVYMEMDWTFRAKFLSQICGKHQILPQQMFSEEDLLNSDATNILHLKQNIIYAQCKWLLDWNLSVLQLKYFKLIFILKTGKSFMEETLSSVMRLHFFK